jgi:hypothetical protein
MALTLHLNTQDFAKTYPELPVGTRVAWNEAEREYRGTVIGYSGLGLCSIVFLDAEFHEGATAPAVEVRSFSIYRGVAPVYRGVAPVIIRVLV